MSPHFPSTRKTVTPRQARALGGGAILLVVALEVAGRIACGGRDFGSLGIALAFLLIPLSPALVALLTPNPLCAVAAAAPVAGWIAYAIYFDCVRPYQGGGASLVYVGVWFYGFMSATVAAIAAIPLLRLSGVRVSGTEPLQGPPK